jgi:hypothetical protein
VNGVYLLFRPLSVPSQQRFALDIVRFVRTPKMGGAALVDSRCAITGGSVPTRDEINSAGIGRLRWCRADVEFLAVCA